MKKLPGQVEEKQTRAENKEGPEQERRELQANFQLCSRLGTPGASVIYGPCQVEGGRERREGLALGGGWETVGPGKQL